MSILTSEFINYNTICHLQGQEIAARVQEADHQLERVLRPSEQEIYAARAILR